MRCEKIVSLISRHSSFGFQISKLVDVETLWNKLSARIYEIYEIVFNFFFDKKWNWAVVIWSPIWTALRKWSASLWASSVREHAPFRGRAFLSFGRTYSWCIRECRRWFESFCLELPILDSSTNRPEKLLRQSLRLRFTEVNEVWNSHSTEFYRRCYLVGV